MLLLLSKDVNVCEISKVLVKYKIKARIDGDTIYLDGTLPDELLDTLSSMVTVVGVQNYTSKTNFTNYSSNRFTHTPMFIAKATKPKQVVEAPVKEESPALESINEDSTAPSVVENTEEVTETTDESEIVETVNAETDEVVVKTPESSRKVRIVKRGEVYRCDLGDAVGSEQGGIRPVIVIQNDKGNKYSPTTIVIPFTTRYKPKYLPTHFTFKFTEETMVDYTKAHPGLTSGYSTALAEQIQTVDKTRFMQYLGTMTDSFMDELSSFICTSLSLTTEEKNEASEAIAPVKETKPAATKEQPVSAPVKAPVVQPAKPVAVPKVQPTSPPTPKKKKKSTFRKDSDYDPREKQISKIKQEPPKPVPVVQSIEELNEVQRELLKFANLTDVYNICSDAMSDKDKVKILLEIFGFDSSRRGVDLLNDAIFASLRCQYYNLETLSNLIHKIHSEIVPSEIQRLIVARVKENFKMKKAPTSDFIRLINNLIKTKGELVNE